MGIEAPPMDVIEKEYAYYAKAKTDAALVVCGFVEDDELRLEALMMLGLIPDKDKP